MKNMPEKLKSKRKTKQFTPANNRRAVGAILAVLTIGVFLLFIARFGIIVATGKVAGTSLDEKTAALYQGTATVKAKRGTIYDRNGEVIATDATSYSLYAVLDETYKVGDEKLYVESKNISKIAEILSENTELSEAEVTKYLSQTTNSEGDKLSQVEFGTNGKNLSLETKNAIEKQMEKAEIKGIYFTEHPDRIYPNGSFASYLVGYTKYADANDESQGLTGVMGIESAYDDVLSGTDGEVRFQKDSNGNAIPGTSVVTKEAQDGKDIYLTLDKTLQLYTEEELAKYQEEFDPEYYTAMLVEAKTGNILAAAQTPSFNPETWKEELSKTGATWDDLLVQRAFEPGSTIKAFTVAAAIETGHFNPGAVFKAGYMKLYDVTVKDATTYDYLTFQDALIVSSNIGMINLEMMMDENDETVWQNYLRSFGFEKSTNSGLEGEAEGYIQGGNAVDRAMTAYGQALSVTCFQMVQGYTAFANGGEMLKPQYIQKVVDTATGNEQVTQREVVGTPISAATATQVLNNMEQVVTDSRGTARSSAIEGVNVSAKTGTAQFIEDGKYLDGETDYIYSVVELVPTEDPEYLLYITVKKPKTFDSQRTFAEFGNNLMKKALELDSDKNVADTQEESITIQDYTNQSATSLADGTLGEKLSVIVIGDGDATLSQSAASGDVLMTGQKLMLYTGGTVTLPDFTGWSKNDILKYCELAKIEVNFTGQGYGRKQNLKEGTTVSEGATLSVSLGDITS